MADPQYKVHTRINMATIRMNLNALLNKTMNDISRDLLNAIEDIVEESARNIFTPAVFEAESFVDMSTLYKCFVEASQQKIQDKIEEILSTTKKELTDKEFTRNILDTTMSSIGFSYYPIEIE